MTRGSPESSRCLSRRVRAAGTRFLSFIFGTAVGFPHAGFLRQQHALRRRALHAVPVLAIKAMFTGPVMPGELRELDLLPEEREAHARDTPFAAPFPVNQLPRRVPGDPSQLAAHRLAHLTDTAITLPPNAHPFTPEMQRAVERAERGDDQAVRQPI